jgi:hypothetical protein
MRAKTYSNETTCTKTLCDKKNLDRNSNCEMIFNKAQSESSGCIKCINWGFSFVKTSFLKLSMSGPTLGHYQDQECQPRHNWEKVSQNFLLKIYGDWSQSPFCLLPNYNYLPDYNLFFSDIIRGSSLSIIKLNFNPEISQYLDNFLILYGLNL